MMKTKLTILILLLWAGNCLAAELLVHAKPHWMDSFTQTEVDKLSPGDKQSYEARSQIGDIVVVRPDNWVWGKEECLPNFVVVKVPGMNEVEAKQYEQSLMEQKGIDEHGAPIMVMLRHRKYALPKTDITAIKTNTVTFSKTSLIANTITKIGLATEISAPINSPIAYLWRRIAKKVNPYLNTAYNYWVKKCFAAEFLKKTVMPSGGDYTSLEACMNANEQDLTGDGWFTVEIDGTWSSADTTAVVVHNYTTTSSDYINIYTTSAARHKGITSTSYYRLAMSTAGQYPIKVYVNNLTVDGLQIGLNTNGFTADSTGFWLADNVSGVHTIKNNIFYMAASADNYNSANGIKTQYSNSPTMYIYNNIFYKLAANGVSDITIWNYGGGTYYIYNNTMYGQSAVGGTKGINADQGTLYLKNNISVLHDADYDDMVGATVHASSTNNLASDTTTPEYNTYYDSKTVSFVDAANGDCHLKSDDTSAIDYGADLSAEFFTDDIDGVTRSGTWDIGADEYVAAGGAVDDSRVFLL